MDEALGNFELEKVRVHCISGLLHRAGRGLEFVGHLHFSKLSAPLTLRITRLVYLHSAGLGAGLAGALGLTGDHVGLQMTVHDGKRELMQVKIDSEKKEIEKVWSEKIYNFVELNVSTRTHEGCSHGTTLAVGALVNPGREGLVLASVSK